MSELLENYISVTSPVCLLVQLDIIDKDRFFAKYVGHSGPIHQKHGVEVLVGTPEVTVLEGNYNKNLTVVLKFPSVKAQKNGYADPDYHLLKAIRGQATNVKNTTLIVAPQFVPPQH